MFLTVDRKSPETPSKALPHSGNVGSHFLVLDPEREFARSQGERLFCPKSCLGRPLRSAATSGFVELGEFLKVLGGREQSRRNIQFRRHGLEQDPQELHGGGSGSGQVGMSNRPSSIRGIASGARFRPRAKRPRHGISIPPGRCAAAKASQGTRARAWRLRRWLRP